MIRGLKAPSFMDLALKTAENAGKAGEVPIGCVVVRNYEVIATAANRTLTDYDPTAHAEIIALREAAKKIGSERLVDCDLYVTLEPCTMCAGAISLCKGQAALLRRRRSQGRRGGIRRAVLCIARPAIMRRMSIPGSARARRRGCSRTSFGSGGRLHIFRRHAPRRRGIQYAAAYRSTTTVSEYWIARSSRAMTVVCVATA